MIETGLIFIGLVVILYGSIRLGSGLLRRPYHVPRARRAPCHGGCSGGFYGERPLRWDERPGNTQSSAEVAQEMIAQGHVISHTQWKPKPETTRRQLGAPGIEIKQPGDSEWIRVDQDSVFAHKK